MFRNAVRKHAELAMDRGKFLPNAEKSKGLLVTGGHDEKKDRQDRVALAEEPGRWRHGIREPLARSSKLNLRRIHGPRPISCLGRVGVRLYRTEMVCIDSSM